MMPVRGPPLCPAHLPAKVTIFILSARPWQRNPSETSINQPFHPLSPYLALVYIQERGKSEIRAGNDFKSMTCPINAFIPPRVNAFSASGIIAGFIPTTEASTGISINREISRRDVYVHWRKNKRYRFICIGVTMQNYQNLLRNEKPPKRNNEPKDVV